MTATFMWFYVFTVPFALLSADDTSVLSAVAHCLVTFALTFGFVGMDLISIQLDDPFGEDENDFKYVIFVADYICGRDIVQLSHMFPSLTLVS
jgi:predicted membrane chloride channel (bestrophin family)